MTGLKFVKGKGLVRDRPRPRKGPRITARKYLGDDAGSWAVFVDGLPFVAGLTRPEVAYYKRQAQESLDAEVAYYKRQAQESLDAREAKNRAIIEVKSTAGSWEDLPPAKSLNEIYSKSGPDRRYQDWLMACASNLGQTCKDREEAYQWLITNASETTTEDFDGEQGVLDECNGLLNTKEAAHA